ncbi:ZBED8 protein, partial [Polyodon spathula]|nr:ZBED8 protein [Polyodon spathula]
MCLVCLQLDETTNVINCAQLIAFVRYVNARGGKHDFLFCEQLERTTKAQDIFNKVNAFLESNGIEWKNLCGLCTDSAPAIMGAWSGFQQIVKCVSPNVIVTHCGIHRGEYKVLLYHIQVQWLSRGQALKCVFVLHEEMAELLRALHKVFSQYFPALPEALHSLLKNPFFVMAEQLPTEDIRAQEQFIDMISDDGVKAKFTQLLLNQFWCSVASEYPLVSEMALKGLLLFPTTYKYESGLSSLLTIKTKS